MLGAAQNVGVPNIPNILGPKGPYGPNRLGWEGHGAPKVPRGGRSIINSHYYSIVVLLPTMPYGYYATATTNTMISLVT